MLLYCFFELQKFKKKYWHENYQDRSFKIIVLSITCLEIEEKFTSLASFVVYSTFVSGDEILVY